MSRFSYKVVVLSLPRLGPCGAGPGRWQRATGGGTRTGRHGSRPTAVGRVLATGTRPWTTTARAVIHDPDTSSSLPRAMGANKASGPSRVHEDGASPTVDAGRPRRVCSVALSGR